MKVNADAGTATNLDADKVDGFDSTNFVRTDTDAGGDLAGTYPNPDIAQGAVGSVEVSDGNLDLADVVESTPVADCNGFGCNLTIGAHTCQEWSIDAPNADVGDFVLVNPLVNVPLRIVADPIGTIPAGPRDPYPFAECGRYATSQTVT